MKPIRWILVPVLVAGIHALSAAPAISASERTPACGHPADILNLADWKLTLPTGSTGHPTEIKQPMLATHSAVPWFTPDAECDGVQFRAPVNGVTTSGSRYPRSELREMSGGSGEASWSTDSGTSTMVIDEAITHLPEGKAQVVAGQIHGQADDVTVFRLEGSKLYVTKGNDAHYRLAAADYRPGTRFTARFVAESGQIKAYYNEKLVASFGVKSDGNYFKAGAYTQANCTNSTPCQADNYGEVVIYGLNVSHRN